MTPEQLDEVARHVQQRLDQLTRTIAAAASTSGTSPRLWHKVLSREGNVTERSLRQMARGLDESPRTILELAGYEWVEPNPEPDPKPTRDDPQTVLEFLRRFEARLEAAGLLPPEQSDDPPGEQSAQRSAGRRGGAPGTNRKDNRDKK